MHSIGKNFLSACAHRERPSLRDEVLSEQATLALKATANVENRIQTIFFWCTSLEQLLGARFVAIAYFLEDPFQDFCATLA